MVEKIESLIKTFILFPLYRYWPVLLGLFIIAMVVVMAYCQE